jgi:DNA mismatch endonuclease (patch repair protein)
MVDKFSKEKRSMIMSAIRSKDTGPEVILRKALWAQGFKFRKHYGSEKIDIAFPAVKIAIFVDGCFWHGCPIHSHIPKSNENYWRPKLQKNMERDKIKENRLSQNGWIVIRFWEHELVNMDSVIAKVKAVMEKQKS